MKKLDIICQGVQQLILYGQQIGSTLEDMSSFAKYLGGSSANIAYGCAKLGLKSAMLTRVGDEHMGRFVRKELARVDVDVSHVITDKERLTGLVIPRHTRQRNLSTYFLSKRLCRYGGGHKRLYS